MDFWRGILFLLALSLGPLLLAGLAYGLFAYPAARFFQVGGGIMLLPIAALFMLGLVAHDAPPHRPVLTIVAAIVALMASMRGFYWHAFPTGEGFWTANRLSALALFALAFFAPWRARDPR